MIPKIGPKKALKEFMNDATPIKLKIEGHKPATIKPNKNVNIPKLFKSEDLGVSRWRTITIDLKTMQTNLPGVFAAGDIVRGASLVVWAIRDGRDAAIQIEKHLKSVNKKKEEAA